MSFKAWARRVNGIHSHGSPSSGGRTAGPERDISCLAWKSRRGTVPAGHGASCRICSTAVLASPRVSAETAQRPFQRLGGPGSSGFTDVAPKPLHRLIFIRLDDWWQLPEVPHNHHVGRGQTCGDSQSRDWCHRGFVENYGVKTPAPNRVSQIRSRQMSWPEFGHRR